MLNIERLNFHYVPEKRILLDVNFTVEKGEIISILGESGSGKSTLLRLIYGLEDAVSGEISYKNKKIKGPRFNLIPGHPEMKLVPQEFDLLDSIRVIENVGKYLSNFNLPLKEKNSSTALKTVFMLDYKDEFPSDLSGGQRQRVSIARALAAHPKVLLLDEPYSHLDQALKFKIRRSLWKWAKKNNCMVILTTHDVYDALGFSDKIVVLKEGRVIQNDTPENLINFPKNEYIASILGNYSLLTQRQMRELFEIEIPNRKRAVIYPNEVKIDTSGTEFIIKEVRFRGENYWVEAQREGVILQFHTPQKPEKELISLTITHYHLIS